MKSNSSAGENSRRRFMKSVLMGALASPAAARLISQDTEERIKKGLMVYRRLGRTGLYISELSLGGSPLPDEALLMSGFERGINYIDLSHSYMNGNAERMVGRLFKEVGRDKLHVHTRFHLEGNWSEQLLIQIVNGSLKRLQTDYVDILGIHGASNEADLTDDRVLSAFEKLKKEGKYRFRGLTCHVNHQKIVHKVIDCGYYDMITLGYNAFDIVNPKQEVKVYENYLETSGTGELIRLAKSHDIGIVAMKTLKIGGRQQNLDRFRTGTASIQQAMIKWVLDNRNISAVITEMLNYEQMEENLAAVGNPLTGEERRNLYHFVAERSKDYCHLCGNCQMTCPSGIRTTSIQRFLAYFQSYGKEDLAKRSYSGLKPEQTALSCQNCGSCENVCPYDVSIRQRLKEAHRILTV